MHQGKNLGTTKLLASFGIVAEQILSAQFEWTISLTVLYLFSHAGKSATCKAVCNGHYAETG